MLCQLASCLRGLGPTSGLRQTRVVLVGPSVLDYRFCLFPPSVAALATRLCLPGAGLLAVARPLAMTGH